nr:hypothetical protein [Solirubrobacterales bacterium]
MPTRKVLVTIEHAGGTAAVWRRDRMLWLTDALERGARVAVGAHTPCMLGLDPDRTLQG